MGERLVGCCLWFSGWLFVIRCVGIAGAHTHTEITETGSSNLDGRTKRYTHLTTKDDGWNGKLTGIFLVSSSAFD